MAKSSSGKHTAYSRIDQGHKKVAEKLIELIQAGTAPWQKPWDGTNGLPMNGTSGKRYRGINAIRLYIAAEEKGYNDARWMTFNQVKAAGGKVKAGEKGEQVEYWLWERKLKDSNGKDMLDVEGNPIYTKLNHPVPFYSTVFNVEQCEGIPPLERKAYTWDPCERADKILTSCGVPIYHDQVDRNFYSPGKDEIHLCVKDRFFSNDAYYGTALHELAHSTGHPSRLNREFSGSFGTPNYAKEELRAEIASFMLCNELGITHNAAAQENHVSYVGSWIKALKEDYNEIFLASADAEKICDYIYEREKEKVKTQAIEKSASVSEITDVPQVAQAGMSNENIERIELIKNFQLPKRNKLTASEQYMKMAQEQLKDKNSSGTTVDDSRIAQQLLSSGNTRIKVVQTLLVHSPNCVNSYQRAGEIVSKAMKVPSVANALKNIQSR